MSAETSAWAKEQTCGDRTVKAVLREIANWASPAGVVQFLSVRRIASVVEVSTRTVQRAIATLEEPTIEHPNRLGLIRRVDRYREDGGQGACGFILLGYQPPMHVVAGDKMSPPYDMGDTLPGDKMSGEPVTPVSPLKRDKILPLDDADASSVPKRNGDGEEDQGSGGEEPKAKEQAHRGTRLPMDWKPPAVADLPPQARAIAEQWSKGAYATEAEAFRGYWTSLPGGKARKLDWLATWANRVVAIGANVLRAEKAGVAFPDPDKADAGPRASAPVAAKAGEDERSAIVHNLLEREFGRTYASWLKGAAITFDDEGAVVTLPSKFARDYVETNLGARIAVAVARTLDRNAPGAVRFVAETGVPAHV